MNAFPEGMLGGWRYGSCHL